MTRPPFQISPALKRYPQLKRDPLQAWDSADELILSHLNEQDPSILGKRILILNDTFGALCTALQDLNVTAYTDSYISSQATLFNTQGKINPLSELGQLEGFYDLALIRIPKNMSFFEDQLCHLSQHLHADSKIICGYPIKHQAAASFDLLAKYIGETTTSLARKKARLIFSNFQKQPVPSPYPLQLSLKTETHVKGFSIPLINHSNLFSREKLDIGTRFLLENLPRSPASVILDLGCANGIIGIAAKMLHPEAQIIFSDESKMAIQSAQSNYQNYFRDTALFHWTHCFEQGESETVDLVLCNPPFHQGTTLSQQVATQMFKDAHRVLVKNGILRVIGNHHLQYRQELVRIFGNAKFVAKNDKFTLFDMVKGPIGIKPTSLPFRFQHS